MGYRHTYRYDHYGARRKIYQSESDQTWGFRVYDWTGAEIHSANGKPSEGAARQAALSWLRKEVDDAVSRGEIILTNGGVVAGKGEPVDDGPPDLSGKSLPKEEKTFKMHQLRLYADAENEETIALDYERKAQACRDRAAKLRRAAKALEG